VSSGRGLFPEELTNRERQSLIIEDAERRFKMSYDDPFDFFLLNQAGRHSSIELIGRTRKRMAKLNSRLYGHVGLPYSTALLATYQELAKQGKPVPNLDRQAQPRVDKITYRTPDYQLSAAQDYRKGGPGASQHIWEATLGPGTMVFAIHPGATPKQMLGRLPRVGQHKNLLFVVHDIPTEPYPGPKVVVPPDVGEFRPSPAPSEETFAPHTVAVFRRASFDEVVQNTNIINLSLLPSSIALAKLESKLVLETGTTPVLRRRKYHQRIVRREHGPKEGR
jgi:hypothetical protein